MLQILYAASLALLFASGCHDAPRKNPFDPALTPAVELAATLDETEGTVALQWTAYAGTASFARYRVLRHQTESVRVDTLADIGAVDSTAFVDVSLAPNTAYVYRVEVVNAQGFAMPSLEQSVVGFAVGAVELLQADIDATAGTARLVWRAYAGARFANYRIERRTTADEDFVEIAQIAAIGDTVFVDASVAPDIGYIYRIALDAAGQLWPSNRSGRAEFMLLPVELLAAERDGQAGTIALRWSRYEGPDFDLYQVARRRSGSDAPEFLTPIESVDDTTLVDGEAQAGVAYVYQVLVAVAGQDEPLFSNSLVQQWNVPAVELAVPSFASATASAALAWSAYEGPRFASYRVWRRTAELVRVLVVEIADVDQTTAQDSGLLGDTEYFYSVEVVTDREEVAASQERGGALHGLVASWQLPIAEHGNVRLYAEPDGTLAALLVETDRVQLLRYDADGGVVEDRQLIAWDNLAIDVDGLPVTLDEIALHSASMALDAEGRRWLALAKGEWVWVQRYDRDGTLLQQEHPVFVDDLASFDLDAVRDEEGKLFRKRIRFATSDVPGAGTSEGAGWSLLDNVLVSRSGEVLFADDFSAGIDDAWTVTEQNRSVLSGFQPVALPWSDRIFFDASHSDGTFFYGSRDLFFRDDANWNDVRLEADIMLMERKNAGIALGASVFGEIDLYIEFMVDALEDIVRLRLVGRGLFFSREQPFPIISGVTYRLALDGEALSTSVTSPVGWRGPFVAGSAWVGLAPIAGMMGLVTDTGRYTLDEAVEEIAVSTGFEPASELRQWLKPDGEEWMGFSLPKSNQVMIRRAQTARPNNRITWPGVGASTIQIGTGASSAPGGFFFPISFDAGPDGRIYVLDAGNARIQVFNAEGTYVTRWGQLGSEDGAFDFGSGGQATDFVGSVAVDDEGFIYVADVGNGRIQKFAP